MDHPLLHCRRHCFRPSHGSTNLLRPDWYRGIAFCGVVYVWNRRLLLDTRHLSSRKQICGIEASLARDDTCAPNHCCWSVHLRRGHVRVHQGSRCPAFCTGHACSLVGIAHRNVLPARAGRQTIYMLIGHDCGGEASGRAKNQVRIQGKGLSTLTVETQLFIVHCLLDVIRV
jgi:hypothetical protein